MRLKMNMTEHEIYNKAMERVKAEFPKQETVEVLRDDLIEIKSHAKYALMSLMGFDASKLEGCLERVTQALDNPVPYNQGWQTDFEKAKDGREILAKTPKGKHKVTHWNGTYFVGVGMYGFSCFMEIPQGDV